MTCAFCHNPDVIIKRNEGTGIPIQWDQQGEREHKCPVATVYCPTCQKRMLQTSVCEHYQNLNYKPGENEQFFMRMILHPPQPKQQKKWIGASVGNTRTKDTKCRKCGKDLNGWKTERIERHVREHRIQEEKEKMQARLT